MAEHQTFAPTTTTSDSFNHPVKSEDTTIKTEEIPPLDHPMTEVEVVDNGMKEQTVKLETEEDQKTLLAVLQFLKKNKLARAAAVLETEADTSTGKTFKFTTIYLYIKKLCLKLKRNDFLVTGLTKSGVSETLSNAEVSSLLSAYSNEADPASYEDNYR